MIKVAINGFGRIGRLVYRLIDNIEDVEVVAINDLSTAKELAYLLKYDTNQGNYKIDSISYEDNYLTDLGRKIKVYSERNPKDLPWKELEIDVVMECSGVFNDYDKASYHIEAGAKKVIISAPAKGNLKTVVYNVNHNILTKDDIIVSTASCTTNCLAPVLRILDYYFKIQRGYMTTVHAYTNDQATLDITHEKGIESRRGRACAQNIVPATTGAANAIGDVLPNLKGKLDGISMRVPVGAGSVIDLVLELEKTTSIEEINKAFEINQNDTIKITMDPIVSSDIIGLRHGAIVDGLSTSILETEGNKQLIKIVAWYDNEMGYSAQMVRTLMYLMKISD